MICNKCSTEQGTLFYKNRKVCKSCDASLRKASYHANREIKSQEIRARRYKLTPEELKRLVSNACAMCGAHEDIVIDHDHGCCPRKGESCGSCIRGALCRTCNRGLAYFYDDPVKLRAAADYIERHRR